MSRPLRAGRSLRDVPKVKDVQANRAVRYGGMGDVRPYDGSVPCKQGVCLQGQREGSGLEENVLGHTQPVSC